MIINSNKSIESAQRVSILLDTILVHLRNYFLIFYFIGKSEVDKENLEKLEFFLKSLGADLSAKELVDKMPDFLMESSVNIVKNILREILAIKEDLLSVNISDFPEKFLELIKEITQTDNITEEEKEFLLQELILLNEKYVQA